jgi:hypothetical protein
LRTRIRTTSHFTINNAMFAFIIGNYRSIGSTLTCRIYMRIWGKQWAMIGCRLHLMNCWLGLGHWWWSSTITIRLMKQWKFSKMTGRPKVLSELHLFIDPSKSIGWKGNLKCSPRHLMIPLSRK